MMSAESVTNIQPDKLIPLQRGEREPLPDRRASSAIKVHIGGSSSLYLHFGNYPDGRLGELFITQSKTGTFTRGVLEGFAIAISMGLQYGVPVSDIVETFRHTAFEPNGITSDSEIKQVSSVFDYIAQRIERDYLERKD